MLGLSKSILAKGAPGHEPEWEQKIIHHEGVDTMVYDLEESRMVFWFKAICKALDNKDITYIFLTYANMF